MDICHRHWFPCKCHLHWSKFHLLVYNTIKDRQSWRSYVRFSSITYLLICGTFCLVELGIMTIVEDHVVGVVETLATRTRAGCIGWRRNTALMRGQPFHHHFNNSGSLNSPLVRRYTVADRF